MGALSIWHWLIVLMVAIIFFGRGRISALMGDVGKGIKNLRQGLAETDDIQALAHEGNVPTSRAHRATDHRSEQTRG